MANEIKTLLDSLDKVRKDWVEDFKEDVIVDWSPTALEGIAEPVNTVAPAVTGTAQVGQTLSTTDGTWTGSPTSIRYQWLHKLPSETLYSRIPGANAATHVLTAASLGRTVICRVDRSHLGGSATGQSNATSAVIA